MRKKDVHAAVAAKIDLGYDRQHVYDEMCLEQPDLAGKKLADAVRWTPPLAARQHYRTEHTALLAAIAANVLLPLLHGQADSGLPSFYGPGFFTVLPFATIGLGIALARYRLQVLPWLIFFTMVGLVSGLSHYEDMVVDGWALAKTAIAITIAALSIYLQNMLAPKYTMDRQFSPPRPVFPPEEGAHFF